MVSLMVLQSCKLGPLCSLRVSRLFRDWEKYHISDDNVNYELKILSCSVMFMLIILRRIQNFWAPNKAAHFGDVI